MPGTETRTIPGTVPSLSLPPGTATTGTGAGTGQDGARDKFTDNAGGSTAGGRDQGATEKPSPEELCRDNKAKKLGDENREYLSKLAGGAAKVQRFCATLLDGATRGGLPQGSPVDQGSAPLPSTSPLSGGALGFRTR
ncbi:hypothetical protein [Streptomyces sp. NBC_00091]|uniref:hypothetical protein n=1 Tax=Streptomyces sp. NBC_00091 TaxID=2975648 RepID=UPI0022577172|nr:hypothetical protein [Streptomyces sp. NBC_00091]MCX5376364.1 hypothetical protein [Streptomyces sp. NBC_00091]